MNEEIIEVEIVDHGEDEKKTQVLIEATEVIKKESLPALTKAFSLVEIDQLTLLKNQIDKACDVYRVDVKEVGLEEADKARSTVTKYKNLGNKWFLDKRRYLLKAADDIRGIEKETLESLTELETKLKQDIEDEKNRQAKEIALKKLPMRQAYLETLGIVMDDEQIIKLSDVDFQSQVESIQANVAKAKEEAEELERIKAEAAEKAKQKAEQEAEKKLEALKIEKRQAQIPSDTHLLFNDPDEEARALEDLLSIADQYFEREIIEMKKSIENIKSKKAQEKATKDKAEAEAKAQADKERILGESRYAIIEGLGLAGYCTASKQIVIEKAGVMDEETWDLSLASLKARKFEAEEKAKEEAEKARKEKAEKNRLEVVEVADRALTIEYTGEEEEKEYCIIKHNGILLEKVPVWCEDAEDACLYRAYSWVLPLLEKVYGLGYEDGCKQTASDFNAEVSYRNGYMR